MNRTIKNIIMFVLIGLILVSMYFTVGNSNGKMVNINDFQSREMMQPSGDDMAPPNMPNDDDSESDDNAVGQTKNDTEDANDSMAKKERPNKNSDNHQKSDNNTPPPEIPDDSSDNNMENPPTMPNDNARMNRMDGFLNKDGIGNQNGNKIINYILLGIESLFLSMIIIYLVLSRFNEKTFKETFLGKDKIIIGIVATIILTFEMGFLLLIIVK